MSTPEGYATPTVTPSGVEGYRYVYQYKDHLDNVRLSYTKNAAGSLEIIEENNYYPFGLQHKGYNNTVSSLRNSTAQLLGFGGKEEQNELGLNWIDITARNYDPALGRWMNLDPLAEQMRRHSPYNFAFDNPIFFIDPDGNMPCPNGDCSNTGNGGHLSPMRSMQIAAARKVKNIYNGVKALFNRSTKQNVAAVFNSFETPVKVATAVTDGNLSEAGNIVNESIESNIAQISAEEGLNRSNAVGVMAAGVAIDVGAAIATDGLISSVTKGAGLVDDAVSIGPKTKAAASVADKPVITAPYKRPSNATTPSMRKYVNEVGKESGCVKCGNKADKYFAGHKKALVEEYYETGTIDKTKMRSNNAIQPECTTCSSQEGAVMSRYSKQKKKEHGFN